MKSSLSTDSGRSRRADESPASQARCAGQVVAGSSIATFSRAIRAIAVAITGAVAVAGCVATVEERPARVIYVEGPPPPLLAERRTAPEAPGMVWVGGYWHWNGIKYVWIPGHWESPPAGYAWVAPHYSDVGGRYVYHPGRWSRVPPRVRAAPVPR